MSLKAVLKRGSIKLNALNLGYFACLLCLASLSTSKLLQSFSVALIAIAGAWYLWGQGSFEALRKNQYGWVISLLFLLSVFAGFYTESLSAWTKDLGKKVLFLLIPLGIGVLPAFKRQQYYWLFLIFALCQTVVAILSLYFYFMDFEAMNEAIRQNSNIDIIGNMSHIYFGWLLAFSILLCIWIGLPRNPSLSPWMRSVLLLIGGLNVIFLHILTSRTGLISFYAGLIVLGIYYVITRKKYLTGLILSLILISGPFISYSLFPSFQKRVDVTLWDIGQYIHQTETLSDYSLSMRLVAWEIAWEIFKEHPVYGVGIADVESNMLQGYTDFRFDIPVDRRLDNPHNQFLEYLVGFGIIGILLLALVLLYPIWRHKGKLAPLLWAFLVMFTLGLLFESLLERQVGICLFCFLVFLIPGYDRSENAPFEEIN